MFLVIDNYDSFVHNLTRYLVLAGNKCRVVRNDAITIQQIKQLKPEAIILSPGPCTPKEGGICVDVVKTFGQTTPILGICLGHQAIGEAYGCLTLRSDQPMHGLQSTITHNKNGIFSALPTPMDVGRYHSLIVKTKNANSPLQTTARTKEGEIMAIQHETHPVYGLQFHPESILTPQGLKLIENFTKIVQDWKAKERIAA